MSDLLQDTPRLRKNLKAALQDYCLPTMLEQAEIEILAIVAKIETGFAKSATQLAEFHIAVQSALGLSNTACPDERDLLSGIASLKSDRDKWRNNAAVMQADVALIRNKMTELAKELRADRDKWRERYERLDKAIETWRRGRETEGGLPNPGEWTLIADRNAIQAEIAAEKQS